MKNIIGILTLAIIVGSVAAIAIFAGLDKTVPLVFIALAIGALTGQFALLQAPTYTPLVVVVVCIIAIGVLGGLGDAIPVTLTGILVGSLTGHFALSIPSIPGFNAPVAAAKTSTTTTTSTTETAPVTTVASPTPTAATVPLLGG